MAWTSNLRKGTDLPTWDWLAFFPAGNSFHGTANAYDGTRHIYWLIQIGSTGAASTTQLWRFDTWTEGWQYLAATSASYTGVALEYDPVRNVLYMLTGNATTEWRVYNLNATSVIISGVTCPSYTLTTMTPILAAAANGGADLKLISEPTVDPAIAGTASGGSTTTVTNASYVFSQGHVGMAIRITSGTASGQRRTISAISADGVTATVSAAFGSAITSSTTFIIEYPQGTASAGSTTTLTDATQAWTTNFYANHDLVIVSGTGAGQRRRIASNTATVLTLAAAVTGNARTGNFSVAPDATSVFKIVPSSDFLYYLQGNSGTYLGKIDVATGSTAQTWTTLAVTPGAIANGGALTHGEQTNPFVLFALRGGSTANVYQYNVGLNTWTTLPTVYFASETFTTGTSMTMLPEYGRIMILKDSSTRLYAYRLSDGGVEPAGTLPYAAPSAYEGKRLCYVSTVDGVKWVYAQRAGGQELYRYALEWL